MKIIEGAYYRYYTYSGDLCILQVTQSHSAFNGSTCKVKILRHNVGGRLGFRLGEFSRNIFDTDRMTMINNDRLISKYQVDIDAINKRWGK